MIKTEILLLLIISVSCLIQLYNHFRPVRRRDTNPYKFSENRVETLETLANSISLIVGSGYVGQKLSECIELELKLIKKAQEDLQEKQE